MELVGITLAFAPITLYDSYTETKQVRKGTTIMSLKPQTDFGETLDLNVATQVMKISGSFACFVKVFSGDKLIRKSFMGFGAGGFKWADEQMMTLHALTGATWKVHDTDDCNRNHPVANKCNTHDADLTSAEKALR